MAPLCGPAKNNYNFLIFVDVLLLGKCCSLALLFKKSSDSLAAVRTYVCACERVCVGLCVFVINDCSICLLPQRLPYVNSRMLAMVGKIFLIQKHSILYACTLHLSTVFL